ncbi:MAG: hypothetical protein JWM38_616 [Sphingomonas bacterium]|nr:hypothetical protein [Sphingomonas bacterium]
MEAGDIGAADVGHMQPPEGWQDEAAQILFPQPTFSRRTKHLAYPAPQQRRRAFGVRKQRGSERGRQRPPARECPELVETGLSVKTGPSAKGGERHPFGAARGV